VGGENEDDTLVGASLMVQGWNKVKSSEKKPRMNWRLGRKTKMPLRPAMGVANDDRC